MECAAQCVTFAVIFAALLAALAPHHQPRTTTQAVEVLALQAGHLKKLVRNQEDELRTLREKEERLEVRQSIAVTQ
jgi:hypothetical protein